MLRIVQICSDHLRANFTTLIHFAIQPYQLRTAGSFAVSERTSDAKRVNPQKSCELFLVSIPHKYNGNWWNKPRWRQHWPLSNNDFRWTRPSLGFPEIYSGAIWSSPSGWQPPWGLAASSCRFLSISFCFHWDVILNGGRANQQKWEMFMISISEEYVLISWFQVVPSSMLLYFLPKKVNMICPICQWICHTASRPWWRQEVFKRTGWATTPWSQVLAKAKNLWRHCRCLGDSRFWCLAVLVLSISKILNYSITSYSIHQYTVYCSG